MKHLFFILMSCSLLIACSEKPEINTDLINNTHSASDAANANIAVMEFEDELFDFGEITQGERVTHKFRFRNSGNADLIISTAQGSCGCTVPDWPKKPISPGNEGVISVEFNSEGKKGKQHKKITIVANTEPSTNVIAITGDVLAPDL